MGAVVVLWGVAGCAAPGSQPHDQRAVHGISAEQHALAQVLIDQGELLASSGRHAEAIQAFRLALQQDPLLEKAHYKLGECYYELGEYELEITEYRKCLAVNPKYLPALLNLGHAYVSRDHLEEAQRYYRLYLDLDPTHPAVLYNLSLVELDLGNDEVSQGLLDRARAAERERSRQTELEADAESDE